MTVRILLADDHAVVRRGLLEEQVGWQVCAEAASGRERLSAPFKPDRRWL
ncbi:MAG: hypothetical protein ABW003_27065 [Microvirga sp.]